MVSYSPTQLRNLFGFASLLLLASPGVLPTSTHDTTRLQRLSRAHLEFALSLFRQVASLEGSHPLDNVLLSPYSVASVLSQLWLGSGPGSPTYLELERSLHYKEGGLSPDKVHPIFQSSLDTLNDPDFQVRHIQTFP